MLLGNLIKCSNKNYRKIVIKSLKFDSRKVKSGDIFFAIKGNRTSGIKFINEALSKGASVIISNKKIKYKSNKAPLLLVKNVRERLAEASSKFYKNAFLTCFFEKNCNFQKLFFRLEIDFFKSQTRFSRLRLSDSKFSVEQSDKSVDS